jgi:16S rRNA processing protein RimM
MANTTDKSPESQKPEHLIVGQVVAPFGIKGELKANILTEFPERLGKLREIRIAPFGSIKPGLAPTAALDPSTVPPPPPVPGWTPPKQATPFKIENVQVHKGQLIIKLAGIDNLSVAETLRGYWLLVPTENASRLPEGAFYIYQVVGLPVYTEAGELIGKINDVLVTAANDIYVVKGPGVKDTSGELLVPAVKSIVKSISPEEGKMVIADPQEWT